MDALVLVSLIAVCVMCVPLRVLTATSAPSPPTYSSTRLPPPPPPPSLSPLPPLLLPSISSPPLTTTSTAAAVDGLDESAIATRDSHYSWSRRRRRSRKTDHTIPRFQRISTQVLCEGEYLDLMCGDGDRIIVIDAWFGVMDRRPFPTKGLPPLTCLQAKGHAMRTSGVHVKEPEHDSKCHVHRVTSVVEDRCNAQHYCYFLADAASLVVSGNATPTLACRDDESSHRKQGRTFNLLKVWYTCASERVLKMLPNARSAPSASEPSDEPGSSQHYRRLLHKGLTPQQRHLLRSTDPSFKLPSLSSPRRLGDQRPVAAAAIVDPRPAGSSGNSLVGEQQAPTAPPPKKVGEGDPLTMSQEKGAKSAPSAANNGSRHDVEANGDKDQPREVVPIAITSDEISRISTTASSSSAANCTIIISKFNHNDNHHPHSIGFADDWISAYAFLTRESRASDSCC